MREKQRERQRETERQREIDREREEEKEEVGRGEIEQSQVETIIIIKWLIISP